MNRHLSHSQSYYRLDQHGDNIHDLSQRLIVNCSGVSVIDTPFKSLQPVGRHDFYLMYMIHGSLTARSGEHEFQLAPGDAVIYTPETLYSYQHMNEERMIYLWIHFTGAEAESLLSSRGLQTARVYSIGACEAIEKDFEAIHQLFITRPDFYLEEAAARLDIMLMHFARMTGSTAGARPERLQASLSYLNRHYAENLRLETLAAMEYLSVSRYSALFRFVTGRSPQQYLIELRLKNARELLLNTNLSIGEIARSAGYEDALYFSRLFKKHFGSSPREMRNQKHTI